MKDVLILSNGHGEDTIALRVLEAMKVQHGDALSVEAWPMVGAGDAYTRAGVPVIGELNLLPSNGFATIDPHLMVRDLRAGWIGTHLKQIGFARKTQGRYRLALAVGDIVPLVAALLSKTPVAFVGCAKSSWYGRGRGYTMFERMLLRQCKQVFPRDHRTAKDLASIGSVVRDCGNPMMDGLEPIIPLACDATETPIVMLPGSRDDAEANTTILLSAAGDLVKADPTRRYVFFVPLHGGFRMPLLRVPHGWQTDPAMGKAILKHEQGARAVLETECFAEMLAIAEVAIGMAGTANEQAIGRGIPLIVVPATGAQGERYVRMKMQFFGPSALAVDRDPKSISAAILALLGDPRKRIAMGAEGRARMGDAGASVAIARNIVALLETMSVTERVTA